MPVPMSHTEQSEVNRMAKPRILFIMHMPPPVHGAAMMGQYIHDSALVESSFDCRFINLIRIAVKRIELIRTDPCELNLIVLNVWPNCTTA